MNSSVIKGVALFHRESGANIFDTTHILICISESLGEDPKRTVIEFVQAYAADEVEWGTCRYCESVTPCTTYQGQEVCLACGIAKLARSA